MAAGIGQAHGPEFRRSVPGAAAADPEDVELAIAVDQENVGLVQSELLRSRQWPICRVGHVPSPSLQVPRRAGLFHALVPVRRAPDHVFLGPAPGWMRQPVFMAPAGTGHRSTACPPDAVFCAIRCRRPDQGRPLRMA